MTREEAKERIRQNKAAAEFYAGQSRITAEIENALKDSEAFDMAIEALSADAVQGEWIDRSNGGRIKYPWWESCECNQCGEYGSGAYNFCPNCGADMRGDTK